MHDPATPQVDAFSLFKREDLINQARQLSGVADDASTDRLSAFVEILGVLTRLSDLEAAVTPVGGVRSSGPHLHFEVAPSWDGATPVVDNDGDYWDRLDDGSYQGMYQERINGAILSATALQREHGPVKPIAREAS